MSHRSELLGLGAAGVAAGVAFVGWRAVRRRWLAPPSVPTAPSSAAPGLLPVAPHTLTAEETDRLFGPLPWSPVAGDDSAITIAPAWTAANLVAVEIPQLATLKGAPRNGRVTLHVKVADRVRALFEAWEGAGLMHLVSSWDGAFNPRRIRGKPSVSKHAYAIAWDLNAASNPLGKPAQPGATGNLTELVPLAVEHGFTWGGYWAKRPDPMHFEAFR